MTMVHVTEVVPAPGESVWTAYGEDDHGVKVRFGGDWRMMQDLAQAVLYGDEPVYANVEDWQFLPMSA